MCIRDRAHAVRVPQALWNDVTLPDGAQARGLAKLPTDITDLLKELTTAGKRYGGLWSAAGKLGANRGNIQLDVLKIVFRSAGLPVQYAQARLVIWLKQKGRYEAVRTGVEQRGASFDEELQNMVVSSELAESIYEAYPGFAKSPLDVSELLAAQFPIKTAIDAAQMLEALEAVLRLQSTAPGTATGVPLTLLVFDELQQSICEQPRRALGIHGHLVGASAPPGGPVLGVAVLARRWVGRGWCLGGRCVGWAGGGGVWGVVVGGWGGWGGAGGGGGGWGWGGSKGRAWSGGGVVAGSGRSSGPGGWERAGRRRKRAASSRRSSAW